MRSVCWGVRKGLRSIVVVETDKTFFLNECIIDDLGDVDVVVVGGSVR